VSIVRPIDILFLMQLDVTAWKLPVQFYMMHYVRTAILGPLLNLV